MIRARFQERFEDESVLVVFDERRNPGESVYAVPVIRENGMDWTYVTKRPGDGTDEAILTFPKDIARALFKALAEWAEGSGLRPENHERTLGKLDAIERHLGDMRALVGKAHKVDLP